MLFLVTFTLLFGIVLFARAFTGPNPPPRLRLRFSSSNKLKIGYAKNAGCTSILDHDGLEIQESPPVVAFHKSLDTYRKALAVGNVGAGCGLFTEDTAVGPINVYDIIGAYVSSNVKAICMMDLTIHTVFLPYFTSSSKCIYSSTVSITFDGKTVTTITAKVLCDCVPERKGTGGKIDACMIPLQLMILTIKEGDEEIVVKYEVPLDHDGNTLSQMQEYSPFHPRSFAIDALVDLCKKKGWILE